MASAMEEKKQAKPVAWSSERWLEYFRANRSLRRAIPWEDGAGVEPELLAVVGKSLQSWQRGETSDGNRLRGVAARHAAETDDPAFREAVELFIGEEGRHSALLGRFLDLSGLGRKESDRTERLFRWLRHGGSDIAAWAAPVIVAEVLALVYYDAIRKATPSPVLRAICAQIVWDEVPHIRFQCERYASTFRKRSGTYRMLTTFWQGFLFLSAVLAVWWATAGRCGRAAAAGGNSGRARGKACAAPGR